MNLKKLAKATGITVLATSLVALSQLPAVAAPVQAEIIPATTYYVSAAGNDANDGKSEAKPLKTLDAVNKLTLHAGDKILLKRGDVFNNQHLCISGDKSFKFNDGTTCAYQADSDGAPLVISAYGEGTKPVIAANGQGQWKLDYGLTLGHSQHYLAKDAVSSTVMLKDTENIELSDLEITNKRLEDGSGKENGCAYNDNCALDRTGIAGIAQNQGTLDHVVLKNLYVHDVKGNIYNKHSVNGAIYFSSLIASDQMKPAAERKAPGFKPALDKPEKGYPRFNDLQIINNRVENSGRWGIAAVYSAYASVAVDSRIQIPDEDITKYGSTNVVISHNFIKNIGGDAITAMYGYKPVVESNVATEIATQMNTTDYLFAKDTPRKFAKTGGRVAASIWPWKSKDAVFRFNEGFNTQNADKGNGDGMPWDADSGDGTVYEYNYSANNSGGTVMFCGDQAANSTFRFNIAQNDSLGALSPTFWVPSYSGKYPNAHVYNNTFYLKSGSSILHPAQAQQGTMKVENNIFYNMSDQPRTESWNPLGHITWNPKDIDGNAKVTYSHNLYYNYANYPASDQNPVKVSKGSAVLADPGKAPSDAATDMKAHPHYFPGLSYAAADAKTTVFDGYKLAANSPAIGKGKGITDDNGFALGTDFFGRTANTFDIGAVSTNQKPLPPATVTDSAKLVSTTYQVTDGQTVPSKNGAYKAGNTIHVPSTEKSPSTIAEVLSNLTVEGKAQIVDTAGNAQAEDALVAAGMKLKITSLDGKVTSEFPLSIDNVYSWLDDYTHNVQGNVWFGQKQTGANGKWVNIDKADPAWPNWQVDGYYGPGINGAQLAPADRSALNGLLSDSPTSAGATAMAWRAPKTGYITFKVKDAAAGKPAEPFLRQGDATGGTVTVKLLVNGIEKRSLTLAKKDIRPDGEFNFTANDANALRVSKGDFVRVVAESTGNPAQPSMFVSPTITYIDRTVDTEVIPVKPGTDTGEPDTPTPGQNPQTDKGYVEGKVPGFALSLTGNEVSGTVTLPQVEGIEYLVNGAALADSYPAGPVVVTLKAKAGYKLGESATTEWKFTVPATPEFASDTGKLQIPTTVGVSYDAQNQTVAPGKTVTVTATASDGYSFAATRAVKWTFTADQKDDPKPGTDPEKPGTDPEKPGTDPEKPGTVPSDNPTQPDSGTVADGKKQNPNNPTTAVRQNRGSLVNTGSLAGMAAIAALTLGAAGMVIVRRRAKE